MTDPMTVHLNVYFPQMRTVSPQMTIQPWTSEHYHQHINPGGSLRLQWFQTGPIVSFLAQWLTAAAKSLQSCPTLCDPIDGSPPDSPVPRVLQARILEWISISFSNAWKWKVKVKSLSSVRLCDPMDCSLLGSSIHGIFQARVLEWVAIAFSVCFLLST